MTKEVYKIACNAIISEAFNSMCELAQKSSLSAKDMMEGIVEILDERAKRAKEAQSLILPLFSLEDN